MGIFHFACEAARLAGRLTDGELIVLMASQAVRKRGSTHRVFDGRDLLKVSVTEPLRGYDETLSQCLHGLVRKGMLARAARGRFAATTEGNIVKHTFNGLDRTLRSGDEASSRQHRKPERMLLLRESMVRLCAERQGRELGSAPNGPA